MKLFQKTSIFTKTAISLLVSFSLAICSTKPFAAAQPAASDPPSASCAEYLTHKYYPGHWLRVNSFDSFSPENLSTLKTPNIYLAHADLPQTMDEVDEMLHLKSKVAASHITFSEEEYAEQLPSIALEYSDINEDPAANSIIPNEGGNALTYDELGTFADYLVENYSLAMFLEYCLAADSTTFEETYGDFETIKAAWMEDLMSLADGLEF